MIAAADAEFCARRSACSWIGDPVAAKAKDESKSMSMSKSKKKELLWRCMVRKLSEANLVGQAPRLPAVTVLCKRRISLPRLRQVVIRRFRSWMLI
jgi:hypothetical protein